MKPTFASRRGLPLAILLTWLPAHDGLALTRTWIGGNVDWVDNAGTANWSPADEPDTDDSAVFNTANSVNLGSSNSILELTMSGGIDLATNGFDLTVDGLVQLADSSTFLTVNRVLSADSLTINNGATVTLDQGTLSLIEESGDALLDLNAGATLRGQGVVSFGDALVSVTTLMVHDGTLTASPPGLLIFGAYPAGTLAFNAAGGNARIDLDGVSGASTVNVLRNQTLDLNIALADAFSGDINLSHNSVLDIQSAWSIDSATVDVTTGFVAATPPLIPATDASVATLRGGVLTQTGGTITNVDEDGTLRFDAGFVMTGGNLVNNGTVVFNAAASIGAAANFTMPTGTSSLVVMPGAEVNIDQPNFNPDGDGLATNLITIGSGGILDMNLGVGGDNTIGSTITLSGGELDVTSTTGTWGLSRQVITSAGSGTSSIEGNPVTINASLAVQTGSTLDVIANPTLTASSFSSVAGLLSLGFNSQLAGGSFTGSGTLRLASTSTVTANTTISTTTFDWDGIGIGTTHSVSNGVTFTINSTVFDNDGDMDDPISLGGSSASIAVNGVSEWTMTNTLTANSGAVGTAFINGSAHFILAGPNAELDVLGNTTIGCPVTFGNSSVTTVDASRTLVTGPLATHDGGLITGAGTYLPVGTNTVTSSSTISTAIFDFDNAEWIIQPGVTLTVNVGDYDTVAANAFGNIITLNNGTASVVSSDAEFVMDGVLNMESTGISPAQWIGEPLDIGNDDSVITGRLNVSGTNQASIFAPVDFNSDARVNIDAGSSLNLVASADFLSVNGTNNATFTGAGTLRFSGDANFIESTTINMSGGSMDMDGSDAVGSTIAVSAPVVMNLGTLQNFGKVNSSGTNILLIDHLTGSGTLNVNLDNPAAEWTLNAAGSLVLVNDTVPETLLGGSAANLNGTVSVTGDVRCAARLDIGGTVNILTAGESFRLGVEGHTLVGGQINGPGLLGADAGATLLGFGTIAANIDFDGSSDLFADNGILNVTGSIVDVRNVGAADTDGILNVTNAWNSSVLNSITLLGGELRGGTVTLDNSGGITGVGLVSSRVINNTRLNNSGSGTLLVQTAANDNDWDGTTNSGNLNAAFGVLELRDNAAFAFSGTINAQSSGIVFANGFALNPAATSTVSLNNGHFRSSHPTTFSGPISVGAAGSSSLEVQSPGVLDLAATATLSLSGSLSLVTSNGVIRTATTFSGGGSLVIPSGSTVSPESGANIGVLTVNSGTLRPSGISTGRIDTLDFQQNASGSLSIQLAGTGLAQFDRLVINGAGQLAGELNLSLLGGFVPSLGQTFNILSASSGVSGTFSSLIQPAGMPAGLAFRVNYLPTIAQLEVVNASPYDLWIAGFPALTTPAERLKSANPDADSLNNFGEFALDGHPASGSDSGKVFGKIAQVGGVDVMTLTLAVRTGATLAAGDPPGGELVIEKVADSVVYAIQASDDLSDFSVDVTEVTGPDATAIQSGLPIPNAGWSYRSFRSQGPVAGDVAEFMRVYIHN